jgi:hypothetical protein
MSTPAPRSAAEARPVAVAKSLRRIHPGLIDAERATCPDASTSLGRGDAQGEVS